MTTETRPLNGSLNTMKSGGSIGGVAGGRGGLTELDEWPGGDNAGVVEPLLAGPPPHPPTPSQRGGSRIRDAPAPSRAEPETGYRALGALGSADGLVRQIASVVGSWRRDEPSQLHAAADSDVASVAKSADADRNMSFPRVPPDQRVSVFFEELQVTSKAFWQKEEKHLLRKVSGHFRAGELVAVMGPSGAGKTTLLNTISGFTSGMKSGGTVRLQREDGSVTTKRSAACYLTQHDHVQPLFTAREIVMQAADLKVGSRLSRKARGLLVDDVLESLGLAGCSYTRASQLSGGQRKRLAIAAELVDNPYVFFLDEPTTGLDISTAIQCTQLMRRIARSGRAVICTIHQPSQNMLNMFDQVYVLANGNCVYRGSPNCMLPFVNSLGFHCPQYHNPADFMLEVANNEYGNAVPTMMEALKNWEYPPPLPDINECVANGKSAKAAEMETLINSESYQPSEWERFRILVTRNLLVQHRDWVSTHSKLLAVFLISLTIGVLFGQVGDNAHRIMSNISLMFVLILYQCYTPEAPAVLKYPQEIEVVKREWFNNWYRLCTYTLALLISSLPMHVMISTILCSIAYYMTGQLAEPLRFAHITMTLILASIASESLGLQFGSLFLKRPLISIFIAAIHIAYLVIFGGVLALKPEMPAWYSWGTKMNHLHYSFNSMLIATYKNRSRISCPEEVVYCHLRDPDTILKLFGLENSEIWHNLLSLVIFIIILRITGFISLNYNVRRIS